MKTKLKTRGKGKTKAALIRVWINLSLPRRVKYLTAAELASVASMELKEKIPANQMCRELRAARISFKRSPNDPPPRNYSKVDVLKARLDSMEQRLKRLEKVK